MIDIGSRVRVKDVPSNAGGIYGEFVGKVGTVVDINHKPFVYVRVAFCEEGADIQRSASYDYVDLGAFRVEPL